MFDFISNHIVWPTGFHDFLFLNLFVWQTSPKQLSAGSHCTSFIKNASNFLLKKLTTLNDSLFFFYNYLHFLYGWLFFNIVEFQDFYIFALWVQNIDKLKEETRDVASNVLRWFMAVVSFFLMLTKKVFSVLNDAYF